MAAAANEKVFLTANYTGDSGGTVTNYYWVQAIYNWGNGGISNSAAVTGMAPSHNNVVSLNWTPQPTANCYHVWRTATNVAPTTGVGQCIAQGYATADGLVDNGIPAFTFAAGTAGPALFEEQSQKQIEGEAKKEADKAKKESDDLMKQLAEVEAEEPKLLEDAERAHKLDRLYLERYQGGRRETEAQRVAKETGREPKNAAETDVHKADVTEKVTRYVPGEEKAPEHSPEHKGDTKKEPEHKK